MRKRKKRKGLNNLTTTSSPILNNTALPDTKSVSTHKLSKKRKKNQKRKNVRPRTQPHDFSVGLKKVEHVENEKFSTTNKRKKKRKQQRIPKKQKHLKTNKTNPHTSISQKIQKKEDTKEEKIVFFKQN